MSRLDTWLDTHPIRDIEWDGDEPLSGDRPWMPCGDCGNVVLCDECRDRIYNGPKQGGLFDGR